MKNFLEGVLDKDVIAFVKCFTGCVGTEDSDIYFLTAGTCIDELVTELALQNAQSFNLDGEYVCPECEIESSYDDYCEDCECNMLWQENDGIEGYAKVLDVQDLDEISCPSESLLSVFVDAECAKVEGNTITVYTDRVFKLMTGDTRTIHEYVVKNKFCNGVEINHFIFL